jgi:hypothetical protein
MSKHHRIHVGSLPWTNADGPMQLARALGQIAADLWLGGKLALTEVPFVATVGPCHAPHHESEDSDREAADRGPGSQTLERRRAS